jgi:hypothetical protein
MGIPSKKTGKKRTVRPNDKTGDVVCLGTGRSPDGAVHATPVSYFFPSLFIYFFATSDFFLSGSLS